MHPLLILTRHGKFDPKCFMIMVYWAATRSGIAQNWQHRDFLCTITGFDFGTEAGCKAAHAYAIERLGTEIVEALDDAAFTACSIENLRLLEDDLRRLWEAWCSHKSVVCGRVAAKANRRETFIQFCRGRAFSPGLLALVRRSGLAAANDLGPRGVSVPHVFCAPGNGAFTDR